MRQEERARIEERFESERKLKEETISQLRQENKEKEKAILNSQAAMQDIRVTISLWQEKVDEKKKLLDEAKENIKSKDIQLTYLKEQLKLLMESNRANMDLTKSRDEKAKKEIMKLQVSLKSKEKEVVDIKERSHTATKKLEEENRKAKISNLELTQSVQEGNKMIAELKEKMIKLESQNNELKNKAEDVSGKENQWYGQAIKWKGEAEKMKREVVRLEAEKVKLNMENDLLTGHTNANQKIHLHQKIKDENNNLRTQNYKLSEEVKILKEKATKTDKDFQYIQAKFKLSHTDMLDLPSKYEFRIQELEDKLQKEAAISLELSKLPEVAGIYTEKLEGTEPIEQIARAIDFLVQTIRVLSMCYTEYRMRMHQLQYWARAQIFVNELATCLYQLIN